MIAGDWISDRAAVEKVVRNAPEQISELIKWGVNFDKKDNGDSTCTKKADTRNSASCTTRTIRVRRYRKV